MLYTRILEKTIKEHLFTGQIIVIYGPRQVGKTTLVQKLFDEYPGKKLFYRADIPSERHIFHEPEPAEIIRSLGGATLVVIDEAQLIENIGVVLKVMFDTHPEIQFMVTGSSSFDLANKIREPLTGRALEYMLYPLAYEEVEMAHGFLHMKQQFESFMKFGWYPKIINSPHKESKDFLEILQNNTLYKDIFTLENIKKPAVLEKLTVFLANNIGNVVKIGSIAREIITTETTVERYIQILGKMFVIIKIPAYSRNPNNELRGGYKIYFTDIGLRNSIIKNHNDSAVRADKGALFENLFIMERIKFLNNHRMGKNKYFWQTYQQIEIDYLEESDGMLDVFECKFEKRKSRSIGIFKKEYERQLRKVAIVDKNNYSDFVLPENPV